MKKVSMKKKGLCLVGLVAACLPSLLLAQTLPASEHSQNLLGSLPMLAAFGFLFYFLLVRPQSQRAKKHQSMLDKLAKGDEIATTGGLGRVDDIASSQEGGFVLVTLAKGVQVRIKKEHIANIFPKGTLSF